MGLAPSQHVHCAVQELFNNLRDLDPGSLLWLRGRITAWKEEYREQPLYLGLLTSLDNAALQLLHPETPSVDEITHLRETMERDRKAFAFWYEWCEFSSKKHIQQAAEIERLHELLRRLSQTAEEAFQREDRQRAERDDAKIEGGQYHTECEHLRQERDTLAAVLRWFVGEFPCPEIHATVDNRPGRCPEASDDPHEYCASARFQQALASLRSKP